MFLCGLVVAATCSPQVIAKGLSGFSSRCELSTAKVVKSSSSCTAGLVALGCRGSVPRVCGLQKTCCCPKLAWSKLRQASPGRVPGHNQESWFC